MEKLTSLTNQELQKIANSGSEEARQADQILLERLNREAEQKKRNEGRG